MRVLLVGLLITLSGCAFTYESNDARMESTTYCIQNGEPCPDDGPTGPNETVEIHEQGAATFGYDESFHWSVHPGATAATVQVTLAGPEDTGVRVGDWALQFIGPGEHREGSCDDANLSVGTGQLELGSGPRSILTAEALAVGDWKLRLCIEPSSLEYDIRVDVRYD